MRLDGNVGRPLRIIVSGGIGSGKTTAIRTFEQLGAVVIEADRIGHEIIEPGGPAYRAVSQRWPSVLKDGAIDRSRLASIVFTDPQALTELEAISHPLIAAEIEARVVAAGEADVVLELPLDSGLAGDGWTRVVVDVPTEVQLRRAVDRGMDSDDVARRLAAQPQRERWLEVADMVINNTGSLSDLEQEVRRVWSELHSDQTDSTG